MLFFWHLNEEPKIWPHPKFIFHVGSLNPATQKMSYSIDRGSFDRNSLEIVFYQLIEIFIISWPKFLRLFTWSKFLIMSSIKRLKISQLIKKFDQLPKKNWRILAVDQNFKITKNDINKILINCQKRTDGFWQLIKTFLKPKIPLLELSIKCQKRTYRFWHLIECTVG